MVTAGCSLVSVLSLVVSRLALGSGHEFRRSIVRETSNYYSTYSQTQLDEVENLVLVGHSHRSQRCQGPWEYCSSIKLTYNMATVLSLKRHCPVEKRANPFSKK